MTAPPRHPLPTALLPALTAALAIAVPTLAVWSRLPSEVAAAWNNSGAPSYAVSKAGFLAAALGAAFFGPVLLRRSQVSVWAFTLLLAYENALMLWASVDQTDGLAARTLSRSTNLPFLILGAAVIVAFWKAARLSGPPPGRRARLEGPLWTARAHNTWLMAAGALQLLMQFGAYTATLPGTERRPETIAIGLLFCFTSTVVVTVDGSGVRFGYGPFGLIRRRRPLKTIASAEAVPMGKPWFLALGLRGFPGDAHLRLRSGQALLLTYRTGGTFSVSVPDAEAGAAAVNGLIAATRRRYPPKPATAA
ncbi:hypothetical protein GCM10022221_61360 [Actinocorallia aurea]